MTEKELKKQIVHLVKELNKVAKKTGMTKIDIDPEDDLNTLESKAEDGIITIKDVDGIPDEIVELNKIVAEEIEKFRITPDEGTDIPDKKEDVPDKKEDVPYKKEKDTSDMMTDAAKIKEFKKDARDFKNSREATKAVAETQKTKSKIKKKAVSKINETDIIQELFSFLKDDQIDMLSADTAIYLLKLR